MRLFLTVVIFITSLNVSAQTITDIVMDSTELEIRQFEEKSLEVYRKDRSYNYGKDPKYETNFLRRLWLYFMDRLEELFGAKGRSLFWNIIWYGLAIMGLIYLIRFLLKKESSSLFARSDGESNKTDLHPLSNKVDLSTFDEWIEEAVLNQEYRTAIRLYFLKLLKVLDHKDLIEWKNYKTNTDYIHELTEHSTKNRFKDLSFSYEYIWYGEFEPDIHEFKEVKMGFKRFIDQLITREP